MRSAASIAKKRDRRLRSDGNEQYVEVKGDFSRYIDDPGVEPGFTRESIHEALEVLIIGGGFGGLLAGSRLREAGIQDLRIVEKGGDFGGTWYWNRYPGAQCDIEAYIYLPLLEETGYIPKEKYSYAPEILEHSRRIANKYDLYRGVLFQTVIENIKWSEEECRWIVSTNRGDELRARYVVMSNPLTGPSPASRIDNYKGHTFHTSRWDYDYTGGDTTGNLNKLGDKRIAVIGTGATAIQCVPHLARHAKQLYVFQRTPSSVDERGNKPTDAEWAKTLSNGWQKERMDNFNTLVSGGNAEVDLVNDGWTDIIRNLVAILPQGSPGEGHDTGKMMVWRTSRNESDPSAGRFDAKDKAAGCAEAVVSVSCKRPTFNDEYLPAFNRPT